MRRAGGTHVTPAHLAGSRPEIGLKYQHRQGLRRSAENGNIADQTISKVDRSSCQKVDVCIRP